MPEQNKPFVVTDRRKFTLDGEPRLDADPSPEKVRPIVPPPAEPAAPAFESSARVVPQSSAADRRPVTNSQQEPIEQPVAAGQSEDHADDPNADPNAPPPPTAEQMEQSKIAFEATAERIDAAIRAANPGMEHAPPMSFEQLVQSVYMTSVMQLGGGTPEGQKPQVDLMGAKQSIDMLNVIAEKSSGNLSAAQQTFFDSALFELRLAFLDVTQALARSAAAKAPHPGPSIVR